MEKTQTTFRDLANGQTFDYFNPGKTGGNSFCDRCEKVSARKYRSLVTGIEYRIGSGYAHVYHVDRQ